MKTAVFNMLYIVNVNMFTKELMLNDDHADYN